MSDLPTNPTLLHVEPSRNSRRRVTARKSGSAKRKDRPYTEAEPDQFADEVRERCRESDESYYGVASLFRNSHR